MKRKYKVRVLQDKVCEVVKIITIHGSLVEHQVYKGSLSDCEVYIRLSESGYM